MFSGWGHPLRVTWVAVVLPRPLSLLGHKRLLIKSVSHADGLEECSPPLLKSSLICPHSLMISKEKLTSYLLETPPRLKKKITIMCD